MYAGANTGNSLLVAIGKLHDSEFPQAVKLPATLAHTKAVYLARHLQLMSALSLAFLPGASMSHGTKPQLEASR